MDEVVPAARRALPDRRAACRSLAQSEDVGEEVGARGRFAAADVIRRPRIVCASRAARRDGRPGELAAGCAARSPELPEVGRRLRLEVLARGPELEPVEDRLVDDRFTQHELGWARKNECGRVGLMWNAGDGSEQRGTPASVTSARVVECRQVLDRVRVWAEGHADVVAVGVAGSWARGTPRMDSDVDVVVVTTAWRDDARTRAWTRELLDDAVIGTAEWWGELIERRAVLPSGFEVELDFVGPEWAAEPVDAGTRRVVLEGLHLLHDPQGVLARLLVASAGPGVQSDGTSGPAPRA